MSNAPQDQNFIKGKLGVLFTDGVTTIPIACDKATGSMKVNTTDTLAVTLNPISPQDENFNNCMMFVGTDGLSYPWVVDADGCVLIDYI